MDKPSIEKRLFRDHDLLLLVVRTGEEQHSTNKLHTDKEHKMTDRASRHVLSTHVPPPPTRPLRPPSPPHPRDPRKQNQTPTTRPRTSVRHSMRAKGRRISTIGMARGGGGRDGRGMVGGVGVRHSGQNDGGRMADRRLLYHP